MVLADADGMISLTVSVASLWAGLWSLLAGFGSGVFFLLRWFLGRLDQKEKDHAAAIERVAATFTESIEAERARSVKAEERSMGIHERAVTAIESVKSGLDRVVERLANLESRSNAEISLPPRRNPNKPN